MRASPPHYLLFQIRMQKAALTFHTVPYSPPVQNQNVGDKQACVWSNRNGFLSLEDVENCVSNTFVNTVEDQKVLT